MPIRFILLSCLSICALNVCADDDVFFRDIVRSHFTKRFASHPRPYGRMEFTAPVPPDTVATTELIKRTPDQLVEIGYVQVLDDVICRVGLGLGYAGRFAMFDDPSQAVFAFCLPIEASLLDHEFLAKSFERQKQKFAATDVDLAAVAAAFESTFQGYAISRLSIEPIPGVDVRGVKLFQRYHFNTPPSRDAWEVGLQGNVELVVRKNDPGSESETRNMGFLMPLWSMCDGNLTSIIRHPVRIR